MVTTTERFDIYTRLLGKVLRREENSFDRDYSGGSSFSEKSMAIFLYKDNTFLFQVKSFSSLSGGGLSLPSESKRDTSGTWKVVASGSNPALELKLDDGQVLGTWILQTAARQGVEYLDGQPWNRYLIRES